MITIPIPGTVITVFIALCCFYYFHQKSKLNRQYRRDRFREKQEELLDQIKKKETTATDVSND